MEEIKLKAYGKINLSLAIKGKRADGYHNLSTIMQTVSVCDVVTLTKSDKIICNSSNSSIPKGNKNIAFKAAKAFFEFSKINSGVNIFIEKKIPSKAGMGGGSADAAAVLMGLNKLYCTNFDEDLIMNLAKKIGADVPFLTRGGTALAEGIGDVLTSLKSVLKYNILIVKPNENIPTKDAYSKYDMLLNKPVNSVNFLIKYLEQGNLNRFCQGLFNDFEKVTNILSIKKIKQKMISSGALASCMTGSGSAVFGIYNDFETASKAQTVFLKKGFLSFLCEPIKNNQLVE